MSDTPNDDKAPRSDFSSSVGKEITLYLREPGKFAVVRLNAGADGGFAGRLVGVDRFGLWFEDAGQREKALQDSGPVPHIFIAWEDVLTVVRQQAAEEFVTKKAYRGLRPA